MARSLVDIFANLVLSVGSEEVHISADGSTVYVDLPSLQAGRALTRVAPLEANWEATVRKADDLLRAGGLTAIFRHHGRPLAKLGTNAVSSRADRLLGMAPAEVHPARIAVAASRERPVATASVLVGTVALVGLLWYLLRD